jgi:UDP-N-acetylmuramate--alanine ligase
LKYHVIGIGGAGMSAVARLLASHAQVSGSDNGRWPLAEALRDLGVTVHERFDPQNVIGADVVIRSSAYGDENPEVAAAQAAGIPLWRRHEAWRQIARGRVVVAIAGTHGKTTSSAMSWAAVRAGPRDPSLICGGELRELGSNAYVGSGPELVIEADEYDRTFLALSPAVAVVTNVEHDHVDHFPTPDEYAEAFLEFVLRTIPGGTVVACADDPGALQLAGRARERLRGRADVITYGTSAVAEVAITEVRETAEGTAATLRIDGRAVPLALGVPGIHNLRNATAAVVAAHRLGVAPADAAAALRTLGLPGRRLETLGEAGGVLVVDDYAHHPTEIRASIAAMRARTKGRVVACFQPHTASRLRAFFDDFAAALGEADIALVAETFSSARERADREGLARSLAQRAGAGYAADIEAAARELAERTAPGDVALILGAGDVRAAGVRLLELLRSRTPV